MSSKGIAGLFLLGLVVVSGAILPSPAAAAETRKCISEVVLKDISRGIWEAKDFRDVQLFLWDIGHYAPDITESQLTGKVGPATRKAISSFQRSEGLDVTSSIRSKTADKIYQISCGYEKAKPPKKEAESPSATTLSTDQTKTTSAPSVTTPVKEPVVSAPQREPATTRAAEPSRDPAIPTAQFTANDSTNITVRPGDVIRYKWSSTGGTRFVSRYSSDQPSCGVGAIARWHAEGTASGERTDIVQDCQAGRVYTITYDVFNSSSAEPIRKTVIIRVLSLTETRPTATFSANGAQDITVSVGDSINYVWSSTGGTSYVSNVLADQPSCGSPANTTWWANGSANGQRTDIVGECQAGRTYTISYDVITGVQSARATVTVRVRSTTEARPSVGFTANGADDITVNPGDQITYSWSSTGATKLSSTWSSDQVSCNAGSGGTWNAETTSGSRTDTVGECQAGRTYTITATALNGSQTSAKSVTVRVRPVVKFTANGTSVASVAPTGSVTYALQVLPADAAGRIQNAYATYTRGQADACGPSGETGPWTPPALNSSRTDTVSACQAGGGYTITYHYTLDGRTEEKTVAVSIRTAWLNFGTSVLGSVYNGFNLIFGNGRLGN